MHIPDGYLGPYTYVAMWIIMIPIWYYAASRLGRELRSKQVPLLALAAAFSFVIMMFNVPIPGGSTGHAVGDVPVSDGVACEELNADLLDGRHASAFVHVGAVVETTKALTGKFMELVIDNQTYYLPLYQ